MINWEISLGSLLVVATILFSGAGFYYGTTFSLKGVVEDITDIKLDLKVLNKLVTDMAVQNQRMLILEKAVDELRHGHGYINLNEKD